MTLRIRTLPRLLAVLAAVLLIGLWAHGWEIGPRSGQAARPSAAEPVAPAPVEPVADPITEPTVEPVAEPLPERVRPDTVGVLLKRHKPRLVAGMDVDDYLLYLPPGLEDENGEWPLLLWLHGRSLRGENLDQLKRYGPPAMVARGQHIPFIMVAPQLPPDGRWADLDPVAAIVDEVAANYPVDRDRVYLLGFSMGGGGAYRMAFSHGEKYAAMIGIAGHTPPPTENNLRAVSSLPFLAIHGENDVRVPLPPAHRMANAMTGAGAPLFEFRMAPGMNHSQLERLTRDESLFSWLLGHRRGGLAPASRTAARR